LDQVERFALRSVAGRLAQLPREELAVIAQTLELLAAPFSS